MDAGYAVGLAGAHSDEVVVFGEYDGVGLDVLAGAPGEGEVAELVGGGRDVGHDPPVGGVFCDVVRGLDERSSGDGAEVEAGAGAALGRDFENASAGTASQGLERFFVIARALLLCRTGRRAWRGRCRR